MYRINVGISYEPPGQPMQMYWPGDTADLTGWPADDLTRFLARGIIDSIPDAPPEPVKSRKAAPVQSKDGDQ